MKIAKDYLPKSLPRRIRREITYGRLSIFPRHIVKKLKRWHLKLVAKRELQIIEKIDQTFSAENDRTIHRELYDRMRFIAANEVWSQHFAILSGVFGVAIIIVGGAKGISYVRDQKVIPHDNFDHVVRFGLVGFVVGWLAFYFFTLAREWAVQWGLLRKLAFPAMLAVILAMTIPGVMIHTGTLNCWWQLMAVLEGVFFVAATFWTLVAVTLLVGSIDSLNKEALKWRYPLPMLAFSLFKTIHELTRGMKLAGQEQSKLVAVNAQQIILERIEEAAGCMEIYARRFTPLDRASALWQEQVFLRRANAIRQLKKWVILSKADSWKQLDLELRRILSLVVAANFDGLPEAELDAAPVMPWWRRSGRWAKALIVALLPLAFFFMLEQRGLLVGEYKTYGATATGLWAVVNLLLLLDDRFGQKLETLKSVTSILPFGSKPKE
jgi:hypothetical protein